MVIIIIATVLICLLLLMVLYRNLPNKKIFYIFCLCLTVTSGAIAQSFIFPQTQQEPLDPAAIQRITAQQQIFDGWYTEYKKQLDLLDYNWAQCQMIVSDYHNDNISLNSAYTRLNILEHQAEAVKSSLAQLPPPSNLDDTNYDLSASLLAKTQAYAASQLQAIQAVRTAADPAAVKTDSHEEQSRFMRETLIRNAPDALFTASETDTLRQQLTVPEM